MASRYSRIAVDSYSTQLRIPVLRITRYEVNEPAPRGNKITYAPSRSLIVGGMEVATFYRTRAGRSVRVNAQVSEEDAGQRHNTHEPAHLDALHVPGGHLSMGTSGARQRDLGLPPGYQTKGEALR